MISNDNEETPVVYQPKIALLSRIKPNRSSSHVVNKELNNTKKHSSKNESLALKKCVDVAPGSSRKVPEKTGEEYLSVQNDPKFHTLHTRLTRT